MRKYLGRFLFLAAVPFAGCNILTPPANPAAVLEGQWQAVFDEPGDLEGFDVQLTFDADGALTTITATSPEGAVATFNVDNATTSEVDGNQVTITIPSAAGERIFEGTLSEDQNSIDGSLSQSIDFPNGNITLPGSDLTLTRLVEG